MHQSYRMTRKALATMLQRGYDSVQLLRTEEHAIYKSEVIDLRPHRRVIQCYYSTTHDMKRSFRFLGATGSCVRREGGGAASHRGSESIDQTAPVATTPEAFRATPAARACPMVGTPSTSEKAPHDAAKRLSVYSNPFRWGWGGRRGQCHCVNVRLVPSATDGGTAAAGPRMRSQCLHCDGQSLLLREEVYATK